MLRKPTDRDKKIDGTAWLEEDRLMSDAKHAFELYWTDKNIFLPFKWIQRYAFIKGYLAGIKNKTK